MAESALADAVEDVLRQAAALRSRGETRAAIELLTKANRAQRSSELELAMVDLRLEGGRSLSPSDSAVVHAPVEPQGPGGAIVEVDAAGLTVSALREGIARSGCLLVRGMVRPEAAAQIAAGIDSALAAYDAAAAGDRSGDPAWYSPRTIEDRAGTGEIISRKITRDTGSLWAVYSPRMLFEVLELVDGVGLGPLMTDFLGERPVLSANKCTLRRAPCENLLTGWHQDGAFLGDEIGSFNFWVTFTRCGVDAPGMDIVPKRFDGVLQSGGPGAIFNWSLSEQTVLDAAGDTPIVRPEFEAGDALLFDHRLVHRTASSATMLHERHALESWFFTPSKYPAEGQVPLLY
ncbi:MAG TPA: phytanoyl-CoA dioxygenase family protein [Acidimicrobiales bacterium]|jgi:hypothetical protein|nr:phytanoyl-CoA dioxygenase family protein [Acidimicrobiales bacterium]